VGNLSSSNTGATLNFQYNSSTTLAEANFNPYANQNVGATECSQTISTLMHMALNDTMKVEITVNGGTQTVKVSGNIGQSTFSAALLTAV
jgi:hypothetical protein